MKYPNRPQRRHFCLSVAACSLLPLAAQAQAPTSHFVAVCDVDLWRLLPAYPAPGSPEHLADLQRVYQLQKERTPAQEADANRHANLPLAEWAGDVLGHPLSAVRYPLATALMERVVQDLRPVNRAANAVFAFRKRPLAAWLEPQAAALVEPFGAFKPSLDMSQAPPTSSYPSANSTAALVQAAVLGDLFPRAQDTFAAKAEHAASLRVIGGAHFPSDVTGSRAVAGAFLAALRRHEPYRLASHSAQAQSQANG